MGASLAHMAAGWDQLGSIVSEMTTVWEALVGQLPLKECVMRYVPSALPLGAICPVSLLMFRPTGALNSPPELEVVGSIGSPSTQNTVSAKLKEASGVSRKFTTT